MSVTRLFVLGVWSAAFAGAAMQVATAAPEMLLRERCHKSECGFTKIVTTKTVGRNAAGYMLQVKSRSVVVPLKGAPDAMPTPESFGLVRVSYAFCSTQKPAVIFYKGEQFRVRLLNMIEPPAGDLINAHIEYWAVCHKQVFSVADVADGAAAKAAGDLGYREPGDVKRALRRYSSKKKAFRFFGL